MAGLLVSDLVPSEWDITSTRADMSAAQVLKLQRALLALASAAPRLLWMMY